MDFDSGLLTNVKNVQITLDRNQGLYFPKITGYTNAYIKFHVVGLKSETVAISAHIYVIGTWK